MAKYFVYPLSGQSPTYAISSGSIPDGGGAYTSNSSKVTNTERLTDDSLDSAANFTEQHATIRVDKGAAAVNTLDAMYYYSTAANSNGFRFYTNSANDDSSNSGYTGTTTLKGWNTEELSDASNSERYWYMSAYEGAVTTITEVVLGVKLDLTNVILGGSEGVNYGNDVMISSGGNEFSNQRHGAKKFWNLKLRHVSSTVKSNLETMREAVDGSHHNFIYYDDNVYNYVSMSDDSLRFKEIAFGVYDTSIKLTEVL